MTVHLLSTPRVLTKLRTELKAALPDVSAPLSIRDIEQLPYLSAVITEGLRLALGTSQRQTRISPNEVMTYSDGEKQWPIPIGVSIALPFPIPIHGLSDQRFRHPSAWPRPSSIITRTSLQIPWSFALSALSKTHN